MIIHRVKRGFKPTEQSAEEVMSESDKIGFPIKNKKACEREHGKPCEKCRVATIIETGKDCE